MTCTKECKCTGGTCHEPLASISEVECLQCPYFSTCNIMVVAFQTTTSSAAGGWYCRFRNMYCRPPGTERLTDKEGKWSKSLVPVELALSLKQVDFLEKWAEFHDYLVKQERTSKAEVPSTLELPPDLDTYKPGGITHDEIQRAILDELDYYG